MSGPRAQLPIFALQTVLFPGSMLPLKIFEQRYMDMATDCLRHDSTFGVCLIAEGTEVGGPATPHEIGVTARIAGWDMEQLGVLKVTTRGEQRFRILDRESNRQGLLIARVDMLPAEAAHAVPKAMQPLIPLLRAIADDLGEERMPQPHAFGDASWVGYRYCEVLPISLIARQKLLELDDSVMRLKIIFDFLSQRGLIG